VSENNSSTGGVGGLISMKAPSMPGYVKLEGYVGK